MVSSSDINNAVEFFPTRPGTNTLPQVKILCVANRRVEIDDQLGAHRFDSGQVFTLAAVIDSGRYALVLSDLLRSGSLLIHLVATSDLRPL